MRIAAVAAVLIALARPAAAEDTELSPGAAAALSLVPTLGGIAITAWGSTTHGPEGTKIVTVGLVAANLGPTVGNIYAHDVWNPGLATRLTGVGLGVTGIALVVGSGCFIECRGNRTMAELGGVVMVAGGLTYVFGAVIEIGNAYSAAKAHNERLAAKRDLAIIPVVRRTGAGLALAGTF